MKEQKIQGYVDIRTIKIWTNKNGKCVWIASEPPDCKVIVNEKTGPKVVYTNWSLDSCILWAKKFGDKF